MPKPSGQHERSHSLQIYIETDIEHETKVWKIQSIKKYNHEYNKKS